MVFLGCFVSMKGYILLPSSLGSFDTMKIIIRAIIEYQNQNVKTFNNHIFIQVDCNQLLLSLTIR